MDDIVLPKNTQQAIKMARYMKNHFVFMGVTAPERKQCIKVLLKESRELDLKDLRVLITSYYQKTEREYHYIAIDLAIHNVNRMPLDDVLLYKKFVTEKAWWDSVDAWRKFFGLWSKQNFSQMPQVFAAFFGDKNFWNRRIAINLQLLFKEKTNVALLEKAILYDEKTEEFFIQKAIAWSLREYSKTNPQWVKAFIQKTQLSRLSIREGSKYLPK